LQSTSTSVKNYIIDWGGSTINFNNTALTTGNLFTVGATSPSNAHDKERIDFRNLILIGPEAEAAHTTNDNSTTTTTLYLNNALHIACENLLIRQSYKGLHTNFVFPATFTNIEVRTSYIPYHIDSNSTTAVWTKCGATDSYFSWLFQPTVNGDQLSNQVLKGCRAENCERGFHLDPLDGASFGLDSIVLLDPYFENVTGHHNSHGKAFDFTDALSVGADRTGGVANCDIIGGLWSKAGAWSASRAPLVCSTTGTVTGAHYAIPTVFSNILGKPVKYRFTQKIDTTSGVNVDLMSFDASQAFVVFAGATAAISASVGNLASTAVTRISLGLYDVNILNAYAGANSIFAHATCDDGFVEFDTGNSDSTTVRLKCYDKSSTPALFDPSRVRASINGVLT
jgi:hypothetical protein